MYQESEAEEESFSCTTLEKPVCFLVLIAASHKAISFPAVFEPIQLSYVTRETPSLGFTEGQQVATRWRTVTWSLIAVHSYSHWSIFNQAFAGLRSRELSSVCCELTLELWAAEINAVWNRGRARDYSFKSTYMETYFSWHGTLKFMVHSLYLFLERLYGMWFFPLAEKYGFILCDLKMLSVIFTYAITI